MIVPDRIKELTETFDNNLDSYKKGIYNETQVRREFIDPFFEELGWDVANKRGYPEAYKDVIHEDAIKVGGVTKAPDYCFRDGGARKFFFRSEKAVRQHPGRHQPGLPVAPIRLERQAAPQHFDGL